MPMLGITEEQAKDHEYSLVHEDYKGRPFPPTMIQAGTKEAMLSDSVRLYNVLDQAGVEVVL
jgi:monoterpene epsilon-lactone hydrolase